MHFGHRETEKSQRYVKTGCGMALLRYLIAWLVACLAVIDVGSWPPRTEGGENPERLHSLGGT